MSKKITTQQLEEENKKLNVNVNENENEIKDSNIQRLIEEPKEIKSPNSLDKNKFKEILTIIDSNKFGHKSKICQQNILTLKTWLIILKLIKLVKQMLKNN